jgi:hypothetical protein
MNCLLIPITATLFLIAWKLDMIHEEIKNRNNGQ